MITAIRPHPPELLPPQSMGAALRTGETSFAQNLRQALSGSALRFSAHAQERLAERGITLGAGDVQRIASSTDAAAAKGARQSVVLLDRLALVVGVPSRTVVTVLEPDPASHAVFTNIDSVVVAGASCDDCGS